jgi:hypothetical protein
MKIGRNVFLVLFIFPFFSQNVAAHKLVVDAVINEDGSVFVDAFFAKGSPAKGVKVEIFQPDGALFKEGKTDAQGRFTFSPEGPAGIWKAVATGSLGHRSEAKFEWQHGEEQLSSSEVLAPGGTDAPHHQDASSRPAVPSHRADPLSWMNIFAGLAFLLALSAFLLSCHLFKELKRLRNEIARN